jgi:CHAT domain-containing protein/tetratricopeptide (TPR) repeat protein
VKRYQTVGLLTALAGVALTVGAVRTWREPPAASGAKTTPRSVPAAEPAAASEPPVLLPLPALAAGRDHRQPLTAGESRLYALVMQPGEYLHLVVEQLGVDVVATLRDPAGRDLLRVDSPNGAHGPEELFVVAVERGRHLLAVAAPEGEGRPGSYVIRIEALRAATEEDLERSNAAKSFWTARRRELDETGPLDTVAAGYRDAARQWRELGEVGREAWALYRLGRVYGEDPRNHPLAVEALARAAQLFATSGEERPQALSLYYLADSWVEMGQLESAEAPYLQALSLWEKQGERFEQATTLNGLAILRKRQGRTHAAIDLYTQAAAILREQGKGHDLATCHTNLGVLYARLGELRRAREQYRRALELLDRLPPSGQRAVTLTKLGDALLYVEGPQAALARYREALGMQRRQRDRRAEGVTLNSIGLAQLEADRPQEALEAFRSALEIFRERGEGLAQAVAWSNLAHAEERLGWLGEARRSYERALALSPGHQAALFGLARVARAQGRLEEAERLMERSLDRVEVIRNQESRLDLRSSYHAAQQEEYGFQIDLLAERHRLEPERGHAARAFAVSERARARSLLDLLSAARLSPEAEEARRFDELSRSVNRRHLRQLAATHGLGHPRAVPEGELTGLASWQQAQARDGPLRLQSTGSPTLSLAQVQKRILDEETLLLEYFLGEERSFLWAVTPSAVRFVATLPGRAEIEAAADRTYGRLIESHHQSAEILARQEVARLSRMLLEPVADLLDRRRLVIVTPGGLQKIPFAALHRPGGERGGPPRPLILDHEIVSLPSASVLAALRDRIRGRKAPPGLLAVVADPVLAPDDPRLPRPRRAAAPPAARGLRHTGWEAESVLALAGRKPVLRAFGLAASRELVRSGRLRDYRILHFATHGFANDLYPELSSLALSAYDATGRPVDGSLRAYEVLDLDLRADLAVLSACRTAAGSQSGGEGLTGLTQGFLHAGVPRLIGSVWDVDDRATGELMERFYTALLTEGLPPAQALRQAQIEFLQSERWHAPYHWAGFILQGEWR